MKILSVVAVGCLAAALALLAGGYDSPVDVVATDEHSPATPQVMMARVGEGVCKVWGKTPREQVRSDRPWTLPMANGLYCHYWEVEAGSGFYRDATGFWQLRRVDDPAAARKSGIQLRNTGFVQLIG